MKRGTLPLTALATICAPHRGEAAFGAVAPLVRTLALRGARAPLSVVGSRRRVSVGDLRMSDDGAASPSSSSDATDASKKAIAIDEYAAKIQDNVMGGGEFGERGEAYVVLQFGILLCIGLGGVPLIGPTIAAIVGPGLILGGLAVVYLAAAQMGTALTPWPVPVRDGSEGGTLLRTGVFGVVRHPIYAGLLAGMVGLSIVTDSANRLLLTAILALVMNLKAEYEEEKMAEAFPDYADYKEEVKGRFVPNELVENVAGFVQGFIE